MRSCRCSAPNCTHHYAFGYVTNILAKKRDTMTAFQFSTHVPHEHAVMRVGMPGLKEQPTDRSNLACDKPRVSMARSRQLATAQQRMVPQGTLYPRLQVKIIRHITKPYYSNILGTKRPPPSKITPGDFGQYCIMFYFFSFFSFFYLCMLLFRLPSW